MILTIIGFNLIAILISYLIGSINSSIIYSEIFLKKNVRSVGSGNAGATNISRMAGFGTGALIWFFDWFKVVVAILIFYFIREANLFGFKYVLIQLTGLAAVCGHIWPIFFKFKGGKGVSSMFGMLLAFNWIIGLIIVGLFWICIYLFDKVSVSSIITLIVGGSLTFVPWFIYNFNYMMLIECKELKITNDWLMGVVSIVTIGIITFKHLNNIKKIISKEESSFREGTLKRKAGCKLFKRK
ncbi:MAG: glycerol-3-phosphate acyltransferase [Mycoplasma sp.]|nr:glycerol-3-phosphate acyltransferase [Mycoplasma sp.]